MAQWLTAEQAQARLLAQVDAVTCTYPPVERAAIRAAIRALVTAPPEDPLAAAATWLTVLQQVDEAVTAIVLEGEDYTWQRMLAHAAHAAPGGAAVLEEARAYVEDCGPDCPECGHLWRDWRAEVG